MYVGVVSEGVVSLTRTVVCSQDGVLHIFESDSRRDESGELHLSLPTESSPIESYALQGSHIAAKDGVVQIDEPSVGFLWRATTKSHVFRAFDVNDALVWKQHMTRVIALAQLEKDVQSMEAHGSSEKSAASEDRGKEAPIAKEDEKEGAGES
jgi:hypothetical protein